jgi:hypothetical protein
MVSYDDNNSASILGSRYTSSSNMFQLSTYRSGCFGYDRNLNTGIGVNSVNTDYIVEFKNNKLYVNDVEKLTLTNQSFTTPNSLLLFALHNNSSIGERMLGRIYYF